MKFCYEVDVLEQITASLHKENAEESCFSVQEKGYKDSKSKLSSNAKKNVVDIFTGEGKFLDRIGKMKDDLVRDVV